jgi:hypothetical protein
MGSCKAGHVVILPVVLSTWSTCPDKLLLPPALCPQAKLATGALSLQTADSTRSSATGNSTTADFSVHVRTVVPGGLKEHQQVCALRIALQRQAVDNGGQASSGVTLSGIM